MYRRKNEQKEVCTEGRMSKMKYVMKEEWTEERMDRRKNEQKELCKEGKMHRKKIEQKEELKDKE